MMNSNKNLFLLLGNERTGSTATNRLISGHPEICCSPADSRIFTEGFSWDGIFESAWIEKIKFDVQEIYQYFDQEILLAFIKFMANKNPYKSSKNIKLYGMKCTFYNTSQPMLKNMVNILKKTNGQVRVLHLTRNYDESFISLLVDQKTGRGKDSTEEERLETFHTRVHFTEEEKQRYVMAANERNNIILSLVDHAPFYSVDYSTLYGNVEAEAKSIFEFLNVSTSSVAVDKAIQALNRQPKRLTMPLEHYIEK